MALEPQWWHHPKYWPKQDVNSEDVTMPDIDAIVEEAERRGKISLLEELIKYWEYDPNGEDWPMTRKERYESVQDSFRHFIEKLNVCT